MRKYILLFLIIFLAVILRFWQLGGNPASLDWDEASLGYNAYTLLVSGKDEYGISWPLSIRSFNDYKPPLYTYLTIIPVAFFGLNEFATRFPSAFVGSLSVLVSYALISALFPELKRKYHLLFVFLFAISPWHIQFSRIAFEANVGLFFFLSAVTLFIKGMNAQRRDWLIVLSCILFGLSVYSYHSPRLIVPLFIIGGLVIFRKAAWSKKSWIIGAFIVLALILLPLVKYERSTSAARFGSVTILNAAERLGPSIRAIEFDRSHNDTLGSLLHNRRIVFAREILAGYLDHFNIDFLFLNGDPPGRHHAAGMGMLYWWDALFVVAGMMMLLSKRTQGSWVVLLWFVLAPAASSLTSGTPHAVRALLYLPTYQILSMLGVLSLSIWGRNHLTKSRFQYLAGGVLFLLILNFSYYLHMYWIHSPVEYAKEWQYGYKQAVEFVSTVQKDYDKVIVTYRYDQPYIFFLFYQKTDPLWYQQNWGEGEIDRARRNFGTFEFRNIDWQKDELLTKTLLVGTAEEIPKTAAGLLKEVYFPDGSVAFRIVAR